MRQLNICLAVTVVVGLLGAAASAQEPPLPQSCKAVHADLVEVRSTVGCKPGDDFCFLGEVDGNHGLRGTTYFKGEQGALFPSGAPTFRSYVGNFEYFTANGTLTMREMGMTEPPDVNHLLMAAIRQPSGDLVSMNVVHMPRTLPPTSPLISYRPSAIATSGSGIGRAGWKCDACHQYAARTSVRPARPPRDLAATRRTT
jgi:hypothetical protein